MPVGLDSRSCGCFCKRFVPQASRLPLNQWLKENRNRKKTKEWWKILAAKLRGHFPCHGVSGNYRAINSYYRRVLELVRKWLNHRSQKRSMS